MRSRRFGVSLRRCETASDMAEADVHSAIHPKRGNHLIVVAPFAFREPGICRSLRALEARAPGVDTRLVACGAGYTLWFPPMPLQFPSPR